MNQMAPTSRLEERMSAIIWCLDKRSMYLTRALVLFGIIFILRVFKFKLGDTPFLPFKIDGKDTSLVIGLLGLLMIHSLFFQAVFATKVRKLVELGHNDVLEILTGEKPRKKPQGWQYIPYLMGAGIGVCIIYAVMWWVMPQVTEVIARAIYG